MLVFVKSNILRLLRYYQEKEGIRERNLLPDLVAFVRGGTAVSRRQRRRKLQREQYDTGFDRKEKREGGGRYSIVKAIMRVQDR